MIIDAHTQFGPGLVHASPFQPAVKASSADDIVALLNRTGIDRALVSRPRWFGGTSGRDFVDPNYEQANEAIAEGVRHHPGRLVGVARVNPKCGSQARPALFGIQTYAVRASRGWWR